MLRTRISQLFLIISLINDSNSETINIETGKRSASKWSWSNNSKCGKYSERNNNYRSFAIKEDIGPDSYILKIFNTSCIQVDLFAERHAELEIFFYQKNMKSEIHLKYRKHVICYNNLRMGWNMLTHIFEESGFIKVIRKFPIIFIYYILS